MKTATLGLLRVSGALACSTLLLLFFPARAEAVPAPAAPSGSCGTAEVIDASNLVLDEPGLYCLEADLPLPADQAGIRVTANGVTIDLGGYTLSSGGGDETGIDLGVLAVRTKIQNGIISGWKVGIQGAGTSFQCMRDLLVFQCGLGVTVGPGSVVENVVANGNTDTGLSVSGKTVVRHCQADFNLGSGIRAAGEGNLIEFCSTSDNALLGISGVGNTIVRSCTAVRNGGGGIEVGDYSEVRACFAESNGIDGITVANDSRVIDSVSQFNSGQGIVVGRGSRVADSTSRGNSTGTGIEASSSATIVRCTTRLNELGIEIGQGGQVLHSLANDNSRGGIRGEEEVVRVVDCTAEDNDGIGIDVGDGSVVQGCLAANNTGAGVHAGGRAIRIEANTLYENAIGICVTGQDNFISRNVLAANALAFLIPSGNTRGPNGNTTGYISSTNPYTNFNLTWPF